MRVNGDKRAGHHSPSLKITAIIVQTTTIPPPFAKHNHCPPPPLFAKQKGDASSEARRRGFIHPQPSNPQHPSQLIIQHHRNHNSKNTLDNRYICSNIETERRSADHRNGVRKNETSPRSGARATCGREAEKRQLNKGKQAADGTTRNRQHTDPPTVPAESPGRRAKRGQHRSRGSL